MANAVRTLDFINVFTVSKLVILGEKTTWAATGLP